jgi:hypothetical protein
MGEQKTEKWLAYGRYGNNGTSLHFRIKLESEPVIGRTPIVIRDATPEEIATEEAIREKRENDHRLREEFKARQDYQDAMAIGSILEWMTPINHPLDRLTPAEWAELRRRLA